MMGPVQMVDKIAKHEEMGKEELIRESLEAFLLGKKREYLKEKFELLSRHRVISAAELKKAIKEGKVTEHPSWEDLIDVRNIDAELKGIESDLKRLQKS